MSREKEKEGKTGFHEHSGAKDIRYRAPLNWQHLQIFGWICILLGQILTLMDHAVQMDGNLEQRFALWRTVLPYVTELAVPMLLVSNFARILNHSEDYKKQLLRNGLAMLAVAAGYILVTQYYVLGTLKLVAEDESQVLPVLNELFFRRAKKGFIDFNIFVDLFLCTLFNFFLEYSPKKGFTGKKVILFHLMAILPVAYEIGCMLLKARCAEGYLILPVYVFPLLTVKPPMTFAVFMALAVFIKVRQRLYCRSGKPREDYQEFQKTRRYAFHFSVFAAVVMLIAGVLDIVIMHAVANSEAVSLTQAGFELTDEAIRFSETIPAAIGFGGAACLLLMAPVMLLFSYTREPANRKLTPFVPIAGVALIILIHIQGIFQLLHVAHLPKVDLKEMSGIFGEMKKLLGVE